MEKSISQEERIRRAEEIYSRRRYNNRNGESLYIEAVKRETDISHKRLEK